MAKNVIVAIGDGMGWETTRAAAIQAEIEAEIAENRPSSLEGSTNRSDRNSRSS